MFGFFRPLGKTKTNLTFFVQEDWLILPGIPEDYLYGGHLKALLSCDHNGFFLLKEGSSLLH